MSEDNKGLPEGEKPEKEEATTDVTVGGQPDKIIIEEIDDTPEKDKGREPRDPNTKPVVPNDDDIAQYSQTVQDRIKKLRYEYHEERRAKEAAMRREEEAIGLARKVITDRDKLVAANTRGEQTIFEQAKGRLDAELASAKRAYKEAYEAADSDKLVDAQTEIARISSEKTALNLAPRRPEPKPEEKSAPVQQAPFAQPTNIPQPAPRALEWMDRNKWFGKDDEMTAVALSHHKKIVTEGVDPRTEDYYAKLDQHLRYRFPEKFSDAEGEADEKATPQKAAPQQRKTTVAPGSRTSSPRRVQLTKSQVQLAKRLGVTLEQYAAELLKENRDD